MNRYVRDILDKIAEELGYDREDLELEAELRSGGPTASPGKANDGQIVKVSSSNYPNGGYDQLGSNHIEYRFIHNKGKGKVQIPRTIYTFQLHPLPGNCGVCVNRWVRCLDNVKDWPESLHLEMLKFRAKLARYYQYGILLITTGDSFEGSEMLGEFETIFEGKGRGPLTIRVLDLRKFLT